MGFAGSVYSTAYILWKNNMSVKRFASLTGACLVLAACGLHQRSPVASDAHDGTSLVPPLGQALFAGNCVQCHAIATDKTGPALSGVIARWNGDTSRLVAFVRNSQKIIKQEGTESYTGKLFNRWYRTVMPDYEGLSNEQVVHIITYVNDSRNDR